jgi:hypothetical protein
MCKYKSYRSSWDFLGKVSSLKPTNPQTAVVSVQEFSFCSRINITWCRNIYMSNPASHEIEIHKGVDSRQFSRWELGFLLFVFWIKRVGFSTTSSNLPNDFIRRVVFNSTSRTFTHSRGLIVCSNFFFLADFYLWI